MICIQIPLYLAFLFLSRWDEQGHVDREVSEWGEREGTILLGSGWLLWGCNWEIILPFACQIFLGNMSIYGSGPGTMVVLLPGFAIDSKTR